MHLLGAGDLVQAVHVSVKQLLQEDTFQPRLFLAPLLLQSVMFYLQEIQLLQYLKNQNQS